MMILLFIAVVVVTLFAIYDLVCYTMTMKVIRPKGIELAKHFIPGYSIYIYNKWKKEIKKE